MRPLDERLCDFATNVLLLTGRSTKSTVLLRIADQLGRSASSIGANYEEATPAESKRDFIHKMQIALKESRECCYWLKVLTKSEMTTSSDLQAIVQESLEIRAMLSKAVITAKSRP